ncbi:MAG: 3-deoxy-manno-octulosonate cytidylyltransferase [Planctomycetia bacterium]|nr:3-deoxy-manno-octulosonate cytidylyltransferase [Planctomycetia bacterium]
MRTCTIIIPARLASTRLPNKLLLAETGKPLLQYAWEAARRACLADRVLVACDDKRIFDAVTNFGGVAIMTDPNAQCGTDRIAEVAATLDDDLIVNVQGDEPNLSPDSIDALITLLRDSSSEAVMATLATPIRSREILDDPSCVKVVFDQGHRALYFSRSVIPYPRSWSETLLTQEPPLFYLHLGIYAYRRDFLLKLREIPRSPLEIAESLEQLRVLENGYTLLVGSVDERSVGIDTPEDYARFVAGEREKSKS